jgi:hypothetical protein
MNVNSPRNGWYRNTTILLCLLTRASSAKFLMANFCFGCSILCGSRDPREQSTCCQRTSSDWRGWIMTRLGTRNRFLLLLGFPINCFPNRTINIRLPRQTFVRRIFYKMAEISADSSAPIENMPSLCVGVNGDAISVFRFVVFPPSKWLASLFSDLCSANQFPPQCFSALKFNCTPPPALHSVIHVPKTLSKRTDSWLYLDRSSFLCFQGCSTGNACSDVDISASQPALMSAVQMQQ